MTTIKAGTLLMLSQGEYSDYSVTTIVRALIEFDTQVVISQARAAMPKKEGSYGDWEAVNGFVSWLILSGFVEEIPYEEWKYADGSCFEEGERSDN